MMDSRPMAVAALLIGAAAIAFSPIFVRLSELGPVATAFYRLALGWIPIALWVAVTAGPRPRERRRPADHALLLLPGLFFALDLATWHWSITLTTVANATLLANLAPVFVTLGAWLLFGERFSQSFLVGLALALLGLLLLSGASIGRGGDYFLGDLLGLTTALFYGAYILSVSRLRRCFSASVIMLWSSVVGALLLLPVTWLSGEALSGLSVAGWLVLLGLAWFSHAAGQGSIAYALAHLPASYSSVLLITQPLFAAVIAWLLFGETLTPGQQLGALVVMAGIVLASRRR
jgi:drug/metabolite transporter (DMT)-like permease